MLRTPTSFTPLMDPLPDDSPLTLIFYRGKVLLREEDLALPATDMLDQLGIRGNLHAVGMFGDRYCQTAWCDDENVPVPGYVWHSMRTLFGALSDDMMSVTGRASQIAEWGRTHRYCGVCATPMRRTSGERCFTCPACGMLAYPRISPAMMVLIRRGDHVLLALHTQSPSKRFTPLAGFLEAGESIEEAVHREVYEEVGLRVHNLQYFSSQAWPFPHSLMIAFTADYLEGEIRIDPNEIAEARWFGPTDQWPERVPHISVSSVLVDAHRP